MDGRLCGEGRWIHDLSPPTPQRLYRKLAVQWTATGALASGSAAAALGGAPDVVGLAAGASLGALSMVAVLVRRRAVARLAARFEDEFAAGYASGVAQAVLMHVVAYEAVAFPLTSPDAVSADERAAHRNAAYLAAAAADLPHPVREARATALEALDAGDARRVHQVMNELAQAVRATHTPGSRRPSQREPLSRD
ncbi:hypothetical protein [Streptomyces syringium]|uniref:hypothetical protein n=1 Tax=Streptomyces syringium TaxID=76729 RepID=UPI0037CCF8E8